MKNQIQVVVTGLAWMGSGIGSIESAMERIFHEAEHEVSITSYAISQAPDRLLEWFEGALIRGIMIRIIINHFNEQPAEVIERLKQFGQNYPYFLLYDFSGDERNDLHAKVVVADRRLALIGSSNLSYRGLLTNHELAILVEGPSADEVARALDRLLASSLVNRVSNLS